MDIKIKTEEPAPLSKKNNINRQKLLNRLMLLIVIIAIGLCGYFYYKLHNLENNTNNKKEAEDLLAKVAQIYLIPTGEEPTIATVSDPTALKSQSFFLSSQKGDKVLIFTQAGKAVLYRPSIDKIIEVAPINKDNSANTSTNKNDTTTEKSTGPLKDKTF